MIDIFRRLLPRRSLDVLFYASSWIDELWVRTTIAACRAKGMRVGLAFGSENALPSEVLRDYERLGVAVSTKQGVDDLRRGKGHLVVTASSSVLREWFHPAVAYLIHMPHSLSSLHMIYTEDCFDGYDILFAAGPHHMREFDALSKARNIVGRRALAVGYGKLDLLRDKAAALPLQAEAHASPHVLLAPSWGPGNILHSLGLELVFMLLEQGYRVTMRPHPSFFLDKEPVVDAIVNACADKPAFTLENATGLGQAMFTADLLISDYSGSALEFVALRGKPVIFIDVPKKIVNPDWESLGLAPVELDIRTRLGKLVPASAHAVCEAVRDGMSLASTEELVADFCYCEHRCGESAAGHLLSFLEEL